jgi:site-specific DNA recombinase
LPQHSDVPDDDGLLTPQHLIDRNVARIVVGSTKLKITLKPTADGMPSEVDILWSKPQKHERPRIEEADEAMARAPSPQLVQAVVRAHTWVRLLSDGTHKSVESLAQSVNVHPKIIRNGIRMAFLAPTITKAILDGDQPPGLNLKDFIGAVPLSWSEQRRAFKTK